MAGRRYPPERLIRKERDNHGRDAGSQAGRGGPGAAVVTGRVNRPLETLSEEHWRERGCFLRARDPVYGELLLAAPPWKMSGTPARWKSGCRPPGSDNRDVYLGILGMTEEEYRRLAEAGIF
mgnify:CR=1 FL=1